MALATGMSGRTDVDEAAENDRAHLQQMTRVWRAKVSGDASVRGAYVMPQLLRV